jgi:polyvinyl alcohol dehydrogenase (cytochrome)
MKSIYGRLGGIIFVLASILVVANAQGVAAQEAGSRQPATVCSDTAPAFKEPMSAPHWNGWGADPSQHRFQPAEMAQLASKDVPRLKLKWAFGFPGATRAYAQPTVLGGRIFVGSQGGKVYSLDAKLGCTYWEFDAGAPVRTAIIIGKGSAGWAAYFGDLKGNAYSVDVVTGKLRWKKRVEDHPSAVITGSPTLVGMTLFVPVSSYEELAGANPHYSCCIFRGSIVALDASTGKLLWKSYTIAQKPHPGATNAAGVQLMGPSGAGVWSSPTYDAAKGLIYATTGDNYSDPPTDTSDAILAFDAASGELAWAHQITPGDAFNVACVPSSRGAVVTNSAPGSGMNCPAAKGPDLDFGSSAILVTLPTGKRALIAGQKSGVVTAVDPDRSGEVLWQTRVGQGGILGGVQWGSATDGSKMYVAVSDTRFSNVSPGTRGAQTSLLDPKMAWLLDGESGGGLHALKLDTGEQVWKAPPPACNGVLGCGPAQSAAVTAIPDVVFSGSLDGHLRAYSAADGHVVWDVDTKGEYRTVNGVAARGGSIDGPGAVIVGGMLYATSGSGIWGGKPGNVLLAYSVDGR